ncbi:rhomboid family intramembrane serine protease [Halomicrobium salinisoli]|uniref:rhomboid family intramembrane serine protease n=1 Tax=Halomicrobium salinisoli TaxID=2878391 RepID=UPI001CF076FD|nr:rhomboid family intramembrane serine protease [Halomicrobium salinisoli]
MVFEWVPSWVPLRALAVVAAVGLSAVAALWLGRRGRHPTDRLRARFLFGVPWGTALTVALIVAVYLFVQGGLEHPRSPVVVAFRSWSYFYPLGMVAAAFTHGSLPHLTGNAVGTVVFGTVVEYAVGHYPRDRGASTFGSLRTNPYARALALPVAAVAVGLFTSLFALGPVVGFSGVVFALAGFALVVRPVAAALAILANRVVGLVVTALRNPEVTASARPRVITPWWADVAIQGHAIGVLTGVLLAVAVVHRRDEWPDPARLWFGLLAFATLQGLWALYVPQSGSRYVMFRWLGTALVFVLAAVAALAAAQERFPVDWEQSSFDAAAGALARLGALAVLSALLLGLSAAAVPYNVADVGTESAPGQSVEVRDYSVGYAEDVPHEYVNAVSVPYFDDPASVNASGVIVTSDERNVWYPLVLKQGLANRGRARVLLGGVGWRRPVFADRTGWRPTGNDSVYRVHLRPAGGERTLAYESAPRRASPVIDGRNVTVRPTDEGFALVVTRQGERLGSLPVPEDGARVTEAGLTFARNGTDVTASRGGTRVTVATRETYN